MATETVKITKARIAELQAVVDGLKQEKADVDARLDAANVALYQAEREFKRNAKLTPAMLTTLRKLSWGSYIAENRWRTGHRFLRGGETDGSRVRDSVFYGLLEREAIAAPGNSTREWRITEHGAELLSRTDANDAARGLETTEG